MPRRTVQFAQGGYYHLYNRGIGRQPIFREAENYLYVLRQMKQYAAAYDVSVIAYCLMPNHYHFLIRQDGTTAANLFPQHVFNAYTKAFNKRYERQGTLFQGRYHAIHVDKERYLVQLCCYIHANPVKAGLVTDAGAWPYSNYQEWAGARNGTLVDRTFIETYFADGAEYEAFVAAYIADSRRAEEEITAYLVD